MVSSLVAGIGDFETADQELWSPLMTHGSDRTIWAGFPLSPSPPPLPSPSTFSFSPPPPPLLPPPPPPYPSSSFYLQMDLPFQYIIWILSLYWVPLVDHRKPCQPNLLLQMLL